MIKKFADYEATKAYTPSTKLPRGGYVGKIMKAELVKSNWGTDQLKISFDITEGDYTDYFMKKWKEDQNPNRTWKGVGYVRIPVDDGSDEDARTKASFKSFTEGVLEASNEGYHWNWDETKLKGLSVGLVFNYREWSFNNNSGMTPNFAFFVSADRARKGDFKLPADKMLKQSNKPAQQSPDDFMDLSNVSIADEEMPFS